MPRVCPHSDESIISTYNSLQNVTETARQLGIARSTVQDRIKKYGLSKPKEEEDISDTVETVINGNNASVVTRSRTIRTVEDALDYAQIDKRVWDIDKVVINSWEVGGKLNNSWSRCQLWQVKVTLKRRFPQFVVNAIDDLVDDLRSHKPKTPTKKYPKISEPHMLEVSLFDSHFGKFAWGEETGHDYDLKIADDIYFKAVEDLLAKTSGYDIDRILYPIGNDFFHVNNWINTTARGTPQDVDTRFQKVFDVGCKSIINAIDRCLHVAPVDVVWVPGNHDPETSFYMSKVLEAWYHSADNVNVDTSPKERKYYHYGVNLLGMTHGDEEKHADLPNIMAGEEPDAWAASTYREWHLGHFHKKKETRFCVGDTHTGVRVVVLPSLSGTDKWHYKKGYVNGKRSAVGYLWSHESGLTGHFNSNYVN